MYAGGAGAGGGMGGAGGGGGGGDAARLTAHRAMLQKRLKAGWSSRSATVSPQALNDSADAWSTIPSEVKPRVLLSLLQRDSLVGSIAEAAAKLIRVAAEDKEPWVQIVLALMSEVAPNVVKPEDVEGPRAVLAKHRDAVVNSVKAKADGLKKSENNPLNPMSAPLELKYLAAHLLPVDLEVAPEVAHFTAPKGAADVGAPGKNPFGRAGEDRGAHGAASAFAAHVASTGRQRPQPSATPSLSVDRRKRDSIGLGAPAAKKRAIVREMPDPAPTAPPPVAAVAAPAPAAVEPAAETGSAAGTASAAAGAGAGAAAPSASSEQLPVSKDDAFNKEYNRLKDSDWEQYLAFTRGEPHPEEKREHVFLVNDRSELDSDGSTIQHLKTFAVLDYTKRTLKLRKRKEEEKT
mmetsp:Transcript_1340/g.4223  ORF Transcript_1340/g.4223 Transcript_1340/m.4223 type:complete len:406 (-) Transcript_1340:29-1246(-)